MVPHSRTGEKIMAWGNHDEEILKTIRDLFTEQNVVLAQQGATLFAQNQRLDQLTQQISTIVSQHEALRNDFNTRWNDLPKIYIPRQELLAMGHAERISGLESFSVGISKEFSDFKVSVQQQIQQSVLGATKDNAQTNLDLSKDTATQRSEIDGRSIATYAAIGFALVNIILSLLLHYIH